MAEEPEHCQACYCLIRPGHTYYLTIGQATLCDGCVGAADAIRVTEDLVLVVEDGLERIQQAIVFIDRQPHVTDDPTQQGEIEISPGPGTLPPPTPGGF